MKTGFIFKNIHSSDMEVKVVSLPSPSLAEENVTETQIDGRDGHLSEFNGYNGDTKEVEADYFSTNTTKLLNWLRGSGEVVFSNMPDRYYKARISNKVPLDQILKNFHNFLIQFRCQPFGYLLEGKEVITLTGSATLYNEKATYESLPVITIYGTGSCTFTINSTTFTISEIGGSITIDCDAEEVLNDKGEYMEGEFPVLAVGENAISFTGSNVTIVEVTPNWRSLV